MNFTNVQEKSEVISDVSSDDDARELAKLGKKPVLRVCVAFLLIRFRLTSAAKLLRSRNSWTLMYFDGHLGRHVQCFRLRASEWRPIWAYLWLSIRLDWLWLCSCHDGRTGEHVADSRVR
jgi:hypothetical protein